MKKAAALIISAAVLTVLFSFCTSDKGLKNAEENLCVLPPAYYEDGNYAAHKAYQAPEIDGKGNERSWKMVPWNDIKYKWLGDDYTEKDFKGRYKILWTPEKLYFLVEIQDDSLSDQRPDPFDNWWEDDCLEIFVDEDRSKGEHQYNHNAFAYHITLNFDAIDIAPDMKPRNYKDHIQAARVKNGNTYTWEVSMKVYPSTYKDDSKDNKPVVLKEGKKLGYAVSYNDNDGDFRRENFIGSINVEGEDKNKGWIDAGIFGELTLVK